LIQRAGPRGEELSRLYLRRDMLERQRLELENSDRHEEAEVILIELIKLDGETSDLLFQIATARSLLS